MDSSLATERDNQEVSTALNQLQNISIAILKQFAEVRNELRGMRENMTAIMDSVHTLNASVQEQYSGLQNQLQNKYDGLQTQYDGLQIQYNTLQRQTLYTSIRSDVQDIERRQLQLHVDILRFQASSTDRTANLQLEIEELASRFPDVFHESLSSLNDSLHEQYSSLENQCNRLQTQIQDTPTRSDVQDIERRLHVDILRFQASSTDRTANLQLEIEELASRFPDVFHESLSSLNDSLHEQYSALENQCNRLQTQIQDTPTRSDVQDIERRLHVDILRFQASSTDQTANLQLEIEELASRFPDGFHESLSSLNDSLVSKLMMMLNSSRAITENTMESKLQQQTNALESILIASSQNVSQELREKTECVKELVAEKSRDLIAEIQTNSQQLTCPLPIPQSCTEAMRCPGALQGVHTIQNSTGQMVSVFCTTQNRCCNTTGVWTRVAYLDMTDSTHICPQGFRLRTDHGKRTCGRIREGCISITYTSHGLQYSRVCGRIIAYQYSSPDAFNTASRYSIDGSYVDGVSITHGENPRKHIWTFVAAIDEIRTGFYTCPCIRPDRTYSGRVPTFIGNDYFCETGSRQQFMYQTFYHEDPLWDGEGCGPNSSCCTFNSPPWFCKHLPHPTTDNIEVRVCGDENVSNEDTPLEKVELYIQ